MHIHPISGHAHRGLADDSPAVPPGRGDVDGLARLGPRTRILGWADHVVPTAADKHRLGRRPT